MQKETHACVASRILARFKPFGIATAAPVIVSADAAADSADRLGATPIDRIACAGSDVHAERQDDLSRRTVMREDRQISDQRTMCCSNRVATRACLRLAAAAAIELGIASGDAFAADWAVQLGATTRAPRSAAGANAAAEHLLCAAYDRNGNLYAGGSTEGSITDTNGGPAVSKNDPYGPQDALVVKFGPTGAVLWAVQLGATVHAPGGEAGAAAGHDIVTGVATDSADNVYCCGYTTGPLVEAKGGGEQTNNGFLIKMDPSGAMVWATQLGAKTTVPGGNPHANSLFMAVVVHESQVYVSGNGSGGICEADGGGSDVFVISFDATNGSIIAGRQLGAVSRAPGAPGNANQGSDFAGEHKGGIAADSAGNIIISGFTTGAIAEANGGGQDAFVVKFAPDLSIAWARQLGATTRAPGAPAGANAGLDRFNSVAVDPGGNIYAAGQTDGVVGEPNGGSSDIIVAKWSPDGCLQWLRQLGATSHAANFHGNGAGNDLAYAIVCDASQAYIAGATTGSIGEANGGSFDGYMLSLSSSSGTVGNAVQFGAVTRMTKRPGRANSSFDLLFGMALGPNGDIAVAGYTYGTFAETNAGNSAIEDAIVVHIRGGSRKQPH